MKAISSFLRSSFSLPFPAPPFQEHFVLKRKEEKLPPFVRRYLRLFLARPHPFFPPLSTSHLRFLHLLQDFCKIIIRKMREEDEENFYQVSLKVLRGLFALSEFSPILVTQELFRTLVGPNPPPPGNAPALPYNVTRQRLSLEQFDMVMQSLPLQDASLPSSQEIREMFAEADRDSNGRITYNVSFFNSLYTSVREGYQSQNSSAFPCSGIPPHVRGA